MACPLSLGWDVEPMHGALPAKERMQAAPCPVRDVPWGQHRSRHRGQVIPRHLLPKPFSQYVGRADSALRLLQHPAASCLPEGWGVLSTPQTCTNRA